MRKYILVGIICCTLITGGLIVILNNKPKVPVWIHFYENEKYADFFGSDIIEIELQKSFVTKVIFSDNDLITEWKDFFITLKIDKENRKSASDDEINGGGVYIKVKTENSIYTFSIIIPINENDPKLMIDNYYYTFLSDKENPFNQTYDIAKERHGEINLWQ